MPRGLLALNVDEHHKAMASATTTGCVALTATDPADSLDTPFLLLKVATDGTSLSNVLKQSALNFGR